MLYREAERKEASHIKLQDRPHVFNGIQIWAVGWPPHSVDSILFFPLNSQLRGMLRVIVLLQNPIGLIISKEGGNGR